MALGDVIKRLAVSLSLETAAFEKGATLSEKRAAQMQRKFAKIGGELQKVGAGMTLALTAPLAAFGTASFKAASDAAELQSAFDQTFSTLAADMNAWAEATGNALGRSTQSMQQLANTFGIFFNQAAPTRREAAEMSKTFAVLAQDLASFYNVTEDEALAKLRSGLSGESEPLRDFGVFLSEAAVQAKALEMGLTGANDPLTEQEKIMARYALILESTKNAQGDVARTADGTANQIRKSQAAFEELQVTIGTKLLPAFTPLIEKIGAALEWFTQLPEPVQNVTLATAGIAAALGPVITGIGTLITFAPKLVAAFTAIRTAALFLMANPVILAFAGVLAGIYFAWKNWDKIEAIVRRVYNGVKTWLQDKLGAVFDWVGRKIDAVTGFFKSMYVAVVGNSYVPDMVDGIAAQFARLDALMVDPARKAAKNTAEAMRDMARETQAILAEAFPEDARRFELGEKLKEFDRVSDRLGLSDNDRARGRLNLQGGTGPGELSPQLKALMASVSTDIEMIPIKLGEAAGKAQISTVRIAESFRDMAQNSVRALDDMVRSIQGGGFLDILGSAVNLFLQLGSTGLFGKGLAGKLNTARIPGNAQGTSNWRGGVTWVGERGPELVNLPRGSQVISNRDLRAANDRSGGTAHVTVGIDPRNGNITAFVNGQIAATAPAIASGGAALAQAQMSQRARRKIR